MIKLQIDSKSQDFPRDIYISELSAVIRIKKQNFISLSLWFCLLLYLITQAVVSQTIMFDDFNYNAINDSEFGKFNKWNVINGVSGPPEGGLYLANNVRFKNDPNNNTNRLMTLSTTVNGQTKASTHSRVETAGFEYFEGTYSARVYYSDLPYKYKDANIQTFYTIVSSALGNDGSRYSELDFEYMASDKWGISKDNKVMYLTSWNRYIPDPWQAWKRYFAYQKSFEGWHVFTVSCTDGENVKYWIDDEYMGAMSTTDNDGSSVYPRSNMQVAFANWIWNNVVGDSSENRTTTMEVDWVLFSKNQELLPQQVKNLVGTYRSQGIKRRNLAGQTFIDTPNPTTGNVTLYLDCPYSGFSAGLSEGSYTKTQLEALGMLDNKVSSLRVKSGYKATLYWDDNFKGASLVKTSDDSCLNNDGSWNDKMTSIIVSKTNGGGSSQAIEAENYTNMSGVQKENCSEGGQNVGYIDTGDWMAYTNINFPTSGNYRIKYRVASLSEGGKLSADLNAGATVLGTLNIPSTGGWQNWTTISHTVNVNAGTHSFGIYAVSGGWNINWIKITEQNTARSFDSPLAQNAKLIKGVKEINTTRIYPNPFTKSIQFKFDKSHANVTIFDALGRIVMALKTIESGKSIDLSNLDKGLYMVTIEKEGIKETKRIIKE
ncbi:putative secreted protein (Por secretion system target) [Aquimarina sp. MAR_2010_214]|uniref:carbohydrate-binding protein n=1 Tax=Aquimarina sp. MAR_2010_214 TaxID=1250026 RepID=UPI000CB063F3|nr:carbohydrate-binding protein [Aquimarina sp. MAR_2010_214]PKV50191.1 putative secreted protein (Por secretion system target) [Aquimarina sp. MAR_2010_214]